jgi:nicotinate phosphoribosyltransferase
MNTAAGLRFQTPHDVVSGETSDVYFQRTMRVLQGEGLNPEATMEIFARQTGILCGVHAVADLLTEAGFQGELSALDEGEQFGPRETAMRIRGPYQSYGLYETAILGTLASCSGWARAARECVEAAAGVPVVSFGARHVYPTAAAMMDYSAIVGGCTSASTPAGAALAGKAPMPHAMVLIFGDTLAAAEAFDRHVEPGVPRTVLVDTFKDEVEESLRLAEAMGQRLHGVRLDTASERGGVSPDLVLELRAKLDMSGFQHVQIFISGGLSPDRIKLFIDARAPVSGFGVGSYISGARGIDFTGDLREIEGKPVAKRGRIPGLQATTRLHRVL